MKILHITDSHGTVKSPEGRRDIYYISFLKKLYEIGYVCKRAKIDMVIHTGDLFHTARVSNKFAGQVSELIKAMGIPFYVVPGNHDIEGYTTDTIDQTMLGLLAKTGVVTLLDREHPIFVTDSYGEEEYTIAISGQEYYAHIDEGNPDDFDMQQDECDLNILAIHGYIADTQQHPDIKCTMVQDVNTNADIILTGHYHRQFEWNGPDVDIYNPGSMMRVEQTEYNKTHIPQYGILTTGLNENGEIIYEYRFHNFRTAEPSTTVFDYDSKYKQKIASVTLDGFKNSLANTMSSVNQSVGILKIIQDICSNNTDFVPFEKEAVNIYNQTLQTIPDEFEAQQGYIESNVSKKIKSVRLQNFQSHKDTAIDLSDGLNIIVGESNNGKTAIIRGIMWVIDNYPLGTDFIMAGEKDCCVRITYDDGTFIERGRTLTDTGYYKVRFINENGVFEDATYRGFTNAVPVEVANIHQMPKINITKDIETHLNVLSQLDSPFLITESPQMKAAAIGRITGTHVIDAAVKSNSSSIRSNKVIIKDVSKDIKDTENKLAALPDISLIEKALMSYNSVIASIKALSFIVTKLEDLLDKISDINMQEKTIQKEYAHYCVIRSIKYMVDKADKLYSDEKFLQDKMEDLDSVNKQIETFSTELKINKPKAKLLPVTDTAFSFYQFVMKVSTFIGNKKMLEVQEQMSAKEFRKSQYLNKMLSDLLFVLDSKVKFVSGFENLLSKYQQLDEDICQTNAEYIGYDKQIYVINQQIMDTTKNVLDFILSNKICPCCGQPINSAAAEHVNVFMEEYANG